MGWSSGEEVQADDAYWHRHPIGGIEGLRPSELFERVRLGGGEAGEVQGQSPD